MQRYSRTHLSDPILLQSAAANAGRERTATADLLADLAEIDARKLYLPAGYASMFAFCVGELHLSEDAASKRITAARMASRFPAIFPAVASGQLHLSAVVLLAPHLIEETAGSLLAAAAHKSKSEVERLLAERFAASEVLTWVTPIPAVKQAVWERDGGRCTFVSEAGHRCEATRPLEFDHIVEVPRGGETTVEGIRLLCRAHNQHAAERTFGAEFMRHKRIAAAERRAAGVKAHGGGTAGEPATCPGQLAPVRVEDHAQVAPRATNVEADDRDVVSWLRALGFSAAEARRAAERCADMPDASLEQRVRTALTCFRPRGTVSAGRAVIG